MARLIRIGLAALALAEAVPAKASPKTTGWSRWEPLIIAAASRYGLPATWIARAMDVESGGRTVNHGRPIRSRIGAIGLMQLMPATWLDMKSRYHLGNDPDDPQDNIMAGTAYLRLMYDRFGYPGLFAAYNAGPARYDAYLRAKVTLPSETSQYLAALTRDDRTIRRKSLRALFAFRADGSGGEESSSSPIFAVQRPSGPAGSPSTGKFAGDPSG